MQFGLIEEGKLKGKKVIVNPHNLPDNEFFVEKGVFFNGSAQFARYCLNEGCEKEIPDNGCPNCLGQ